jgi:hypothetical protein
VLADGLQRGVWPIDPAAWPDASGQASGARAAEAGAEAGVEAGVEAEAVETMDLRSFGNRYALVAALHHWLAEAATSIGAGDSGSGGGGGGGGGVGGGGAELVRDPAVGGGADAAERVVGAASGATAGAAQGAAKGAGALRVILGSDRDWGAQRLCWVEEELQAFALPYEVEHAVMRAGEEGCALRLQRAQLWPQLPQRLARAPPPGFVGSFGGGGGGAAAGGRREGARGRSHDAELAEHVEKLRHGLPSAEGWARLSAREARRVPFAEQTPRRSEGEPRDGRRRATRSLRRANS